MAAPQAAAQLLPPLLLALTAPSVSFWVRSSPRVAVVPLGGSVSINCSRGWCPVPAPPPELHWTQRSRTGISGRTWRSFVLSNVSQWQPEPATCWATCGDSAANGSTAIVVYKPPSWVTLASIPPLPVPVGAELTLLCHVAECGPLSNLTVTLRRGTETLSSHRFPTGSGSGTTGSGAAAITVRHALNAGLEDHGQVALCHAELSLRPHGPLFARAAPPIRIEVYALPSPPQLFPPPHMERGSQSSFSCVVRGAFPLAETRVWLELDGTPLEETELSITEEEVKAQGRIRTGTVGSSQLKCTAAVGAGQRSTTAMIRVYSMETMGGM
ncbi:intercellular adhesion molecule 4-like [Coturnix japonica]|nr:intercellular adhesion molecule 4-like [Coturnix japonica]